MEFRLPSYFALATLIDGPLHGYAIIRRTAELSEGSVRLSTGTLYALLERAVAEGLVLAGEPYREGGRQRRDYQLTGTGRQQLLQEAERLAAASATVTGLLGGGAAGRRRPQAGLARVLPALLLGRATALLAGGPTARLVGGATV